jgi:predicted Fe-Mo cluster-binding NifX family protein
MKIVVSTKDGRKISRSFSGCNVFKIYETENGKIVRKTSRPNTFNSRIRHKLKGTQNQQSLEDSDVRNVIDGVKDCQVVICHRMNRRNWAKMGGSGVEMIFTSVTDAENAVIKYLSGQLKDEYHQIMNFS